MDARLRDQMVQLIPALRAQAWLLSGAWSDADQIVQETLVRAWRGHEGRQSGPAARVWLFGVLREVVLAWPKDARSSPGGALSRWWPATPEPDQGQGAEELLGRLRSLDEPTRHALLLIVGAGLTYAEAAEVCGCSVKTIRQQISRGRRRLGRAAPRLALRPRPADPRLPLSMALP